MWSGLERISIFGRSHAVHIHWRFVGQVKTGIHIQSSSGSGGSGLVNGFDRISGDMRTNDGQRRCEFVKMLEGETRTLERNQGVTIWSTAVPHSAPERFHGGLKAAKPRFRWRSDVFNKNELAAGFQNAKHFGKGATLIQDAAQNKRTNGAIDRGSFERQLLRRSAQNLDREPHAFALFQQVPIHETIRLQTYPPNSLIGEMFEVGAGPRTDFQDRAGHVSKQLRFERSEITISFMPEPRHEPGENTQPDRTGAATDAAGFALYVFRAQRIDYNAIGGRIAVKKSTAAT